MKGAVLIHSELELHALQACLCAMDCPTVVMDLTKSTVQVHSRTIVSYLYIKIIYFWLTDYCMEAGMMGFNCPAERLCVPPKYLCDGVPDCGVLAIAVDENLPDCIGQ